MISSKWKKQNNTILYQGIAINVVVSGIATWWFTSPLGEQYAWMMIFVGIVALGGFILTVSLAQRNPNIISRVLKSEYEAAEFALRKTFKDKHIRFHRQQDDDGHHLFEFPRSSLEMRIYPYDPVNGTKGSSGKLSSLGMPLSATLLTVRGLNPKKQAFAEMLAESIDQMANQLTNDANLT